MISVDDHIDLQYVPRDVWTSRPPERLRDRGPQVVELDDGTSAWVCDGDNWGRGPVGGGRPRSGRTRPRSSGQGWTRKACSGRLNPSYDSPT